MGRVKSWHRGSEMDLRLKLSYSDLHSVEKKIILSRRLSSYLCDVEFQKQRSYKWREACFVVGAL